MPYYTKKGKSKKDKGKTCVYKKSDKSKVGCTGGPIEKYLAALHVNESDNFDWIREPIQTKYVDLKDNLKVFFNIGDKIYLDGILYLDYDSVDQTNLQFIHLNRTLVEVKDIKDTDKKLVVYLGKEITDLPIWSANFNENWVTIGDIKLDDEIMFTLIDKTINESNGSDDFDWVRGVETDLIPGQIYDIKTGNGYYWVAEKYIGKKWDDEYQMEFYKFKDLEGGGSGGKSIPYVKELLEKGHIRPYDPKWSIKDELTFSDNIEDALKGNFVIYFKDGVYLDQTLPIQDKLFEMGFSFYTKEPNEYITNKDSSDKIQFFESFNWDNSNPRYNSMPSDQWDKKKILLSRIDDDKFRWRRTPNPRVEEQELFLTIRDHNAIVIDGDKYITGGINESEEFDWIQKQEPEKVFKKSGRYVIDVSHLRPVPMRYSHDTSLTKQDILRKLEDLGYDVEHIDVDEAKYFYVEPTEGGPSWQYDEYDTPIQFDYWVDYNTDLMDDPSYGGKYQMIDVDEFMFLIDNNLIESKKNINEVAGISFEPREWADIIYNEIMNNPEQTRIIIDGYDYPEVFNQFPIDYVVVDHYNRFTGYDVERSGYDKDGNYVVLLYVQPHLINGQHEYTLKSALNHEMRHAWEDYNRISRGKPNINQTKESRELYTKDFINLMADNKIFGPIKDVLKYYYYLSKLEVGPYMENLFDGNPAYEDMVRQIATKDFEPFKERFDIELNWNQIITNYDIPFLTKFKTASDFIDYSSNELRKRANKVIKKINKMRYVHGKF